MLCVNYVAIKLEGNNEIRCFLNNLHLVKKTEFKNSHKGLSLHLNSWLSWLNNSKIEKWLSIIQGISGYKLLFKSKILYKSKQHNSSLNIHILINNTCSLHNW